MSFIIMKHIAVFFLYKCFDGYISNTIAEQRNNGEIVLNILIYRDGCTHYLIEIF